MRLGMLFPGGEGAFGFHSQVAGTAPKKVVAGSRVIQTGHPGVRVYYVGSFGTAHAKMIP